MKKRGQASFGISFGMIFSIFIIITIVAVAFFAIRHFLSLDQCTQTALYYEDLQEEIDNAWTSERYSGIYPREGQGTNLPGGIEWVCFGNISTTTPSGPEDQELYDSFKEEFGYEGYNVFLYPQDEACDANLARRNLRHAEARSFSGPEFICVEVNNGEMESIRLTMESSIRLVRITEI